MVRGIGTDILEVARIEKILEKYGSRFLQKYFTPQEQEYCLKHHIPARQLAGRFAAKEAVAKALGSGFGDTLSFLDIEILNDPLGKPVVYLTGHHSHEKILLSISHCHAYATATAVLI
jgi:holo-[acyl-carrier protein] synthase